MSFRILFGLILVFFASAGAAANEDYNEIFETAVNAVAFDFDKTWAYTETQVGSEHVRVGRCDPRRPSQERWQLVSVDEQELLHNSDFEFVGEDQGNGAG